MRKTIFGIAICAAAAAFASFVFGEDKKGEVKDKYEVWEKLTDAESAALLELARKSVETKLGVLKDFEPKLPKDMPHLAEKRGVFVTLTKEGKLRGCIGTYSAEDPLWKQVWITARDSAFMDPRFGPVKAFELDKIEFEISVFLCPVTKIKNHEEFIVGKHGIFIKRGQKSATFLPNVATEQKWDKETTLRELCKKAGLPTDAWKAPETEFKIYTTQIMKEKKKESQGDQEKKQDGAGTQSKSK